MKPSNTTDVAVIGGGPYGLSVAANLASRGVQHRVFGRVMETWRSNMPQGMYLKSGGVASNMSDPRGEHTLKRYCALSGDEYKDWDLPISVDLFSRYGEWFQEKLVPHLETKNVVTCRREANGFLLEMDDGESVSARSVVVSNGYRHSARNAQELSGLPGHLASHSSAHRTFEPFRGKSVVVIGAGQSALESAALLRESGAKPSLVVRRESIAWGASPQAERSLFHRVRYPRTTIGSGFKYAFYVHPSMPFYYLPRDARHRQVDTVLGPSGAWWLRDRVVDQIPVLLGYRVRRARPEAGAALLELERNGRTQEVRAEHVIAATGYSVTPASFPFLSEELQKAVRWDGGSPVLSRHFESTEPGLHFIGFAAARQFGPVMRFVAGAQIAAPRLCDRLAAQYKP